MATPSPIKVTQSADFAWFRLGTDLQNRDLKWLKYKNIDSERDMARDGLRANLVFLSYK
jgi:hypothetical protein